MLVPGGIDEFAPEPASYDDQSVEPAGKRDSPVEETTDDADEESDDHPDAGEELARGSHASDTSDDARAELDRLDVQIEGLQDFVATFGGDDVRRMLADRWQQRARLRLAVQRRAVRFKHLDEACAPSMSSWGEWLRADRYP